METRKETLSNIQVCRFCLSQNENELIPLYDKARTPRSSVTLALKILSCIAIEIFPSDKMPQFICKRCKLFMEISYTFKNLCRQTDETILQYIQQAAPLSPMNWPVQLTKVYKSYNKTETVKTVVHAGVKVMAEEISDSDTAEDDNVFNIKIGDGSNEGKNIKVITSVNKNDIPTVAKGRKDSEDGERQEEKLIIEGGCYACDECESTYPLEQLLVLHKAQKHRQRNAKCDECGKKFFSKYDLAAHKSTHFPDQSFQCAVCSKKFGRLLLLKRHEKQVHADLPQHKCEDCPASFLSPDELEAHQLTHSRNTPRPFICCICDERFSNKLVLQKHLDYVHTKKAAFSCQYCSERFASMSKLARHVREHAGPRAYPCKHCGKSFTKSHHFTRHMRMKHHTEMSGHAYRCDECDATFATQDELLYHSALHATKNLVCPLCQEKFENVDAVTAHIKSHVNGSEYMCDFCELIFTSKEKLDLHIASTHDEELMTNDLETELDDSSMEMGMEEDEEDNSIKVKEENGHMVVEIKNTDEFMLPIQREEDKSDQTQYEDSDAPESQVEAIQAGPIPDLVITEDVTISVVPEKQPLNKSNAAVKETSASEANQPPNILIKVEDLKRKIQQPTSTQDKSISEKTVKKSFSKAESSTPTGASDKSLRLLEKELQDLKRTNTLVSSKTPPKPVETLRSRRPQLYASTPKTRTIEKKDTPAPKPPQEKVMPVEKKVERKTIKDAKELKEVKSNNNNFKEDKELNKGNGKENKEAAKEERKEVKEKDTPKSAAKNGASETPVEETVRRSNRPSKVKDYAKMIRDGSIASDDETEDEESDKEVEKTPEPADNRSLQISRGRKGRPSVKAVTPAPSAVSNEATPAAAPRKRGRPRKEQPQPVPAKVKKEEPSEEEADSGQVKSTEIIQKSAPKETEPIHTPEGIKTPEGNKSPLEPNSNVIVSPSGQTLKKVPIKSLPPGVKPLPLPVNSRLPGAREVCEMQIGKKVVKVQKIVMTKAEVEAMAKKGLVEMKDGTMVLKQGIKLPAADPMSLKSKLMGEPEAKKESPSKEDAPSTQSEVAS